MSINKMLYQKYNSAVIYYIFYTNIFSTSNESLLSAWDYSMIFLIQWPHFPPASVPVLYSIKQKVFKELSIL